MKTWPPRLLTSALVLAIAGYGWWLRSEANGDPKALSPQQTDRHGSLAPESASPPSSLGTPTDVDAQKRRPSEPSLSPEQTRIADDKTRAALKEMKHLEHARTRLFWRHKTENGGVYIHALLPAPDVQQIEAFTGVLQNTLTDEDPAIREKLQKRKQQLYPGIHRLSREVSLPHRRTVAEWRRPHHGGLRE
jgi:hypothetical protein